MNVVLAGATGYLGRLFASAFAGRQARVTVLTRSAPASVAAALPGVVGLQWDGKRQGEWTRVVHEADVVLNLTGAPLAGKRWTADRKAELLASRTAPTRALVEAMRRSSTKPAVFVSASAVGYYGTSDPSPATESSAPGDDFLGRMCAEWEGEALPAVEMGVRVVLIRTGVVLGKGGGAYPRLSLPFRFFAGGPIGTGQQWFPWIHEADVLGAVTHVLSRADISGPVNLVAPGIVTNAEFSHALGRALRRPSWFRVPAVMLTLLLGEMAEMLLKGRKIVPSRLLASGFAFSYPQLPQALRSLSS